MQTFKNFIMKMMPLAVAVLAVSVVPGCDDKEAGSGPEESSFKVPEQPIIKNDYVSQNNTITVVASGDIAWTAAKDDTSAGAGWLTITSASGKGNGNVVFNLEGKTTPGMRSTTVTVSGKSDRTGKDFSGTVTVQQMGSDPTIVIDPVGTASIPDDANDAYTITVTSNVTWSASIEAISGGDGWVSKTSPTTNVDGNGSIVLNFGKNETENSRQVKLTVASADYPDVKAELIVTQQKPGVRYSIVFDGMQSLLGNVSSTTLVYAPAAGGTEVPLSDVDVVVDMTEKTTTILYAEIIPDGEYELKKVGTTDVNALFTVSGGLVTYVERWNEPFMQFGGETEARPIKISTSADLQALAASVNNGESYSGLYLLQTANIEIGSISVTIGNTAETKFSGIYDGNNKELTNFGFSTTTANFGLFGHVGGVAGAGEDPAVKAVIKNLVIKGSGGAGYDMVADGNNATHIGAVAGYVYSHSVISNCKNHATMNKTATATGGTNLGGVLGRVTGSDILIEKCTNYGKVIVTPSANNVFVRNVGGVIGILEGKDSKAIVEVSECYNYGEMSLQGNSGGVVGTGSNAAGDKHFKIVKCGNYGNLTTLDGSDRLGGVTGTLFGTIDQCFNLGNVTSATNGNNHGGIVGNAQAGSMITNSYNRGTIKFNGNNSGGVVGNKLSNDIVITNCYNAGVTKKTSGEDTGATGGAISGNANGGNVTGCYYQTDLGASAGRPSNADAAGEVVGLDAVGMKPDAPFTGWSADIWQFTSGKYPTLKNNPEKPL